MANSITTCAACGASVVGGARFCAECGTALTIACASCGAPIGPDARFCASCGTAVATAAAAAEERKLATILFADITGSTSLGEQLDPERMRRLLRAYFEAMASIIDSWGGRVEKFIGDAIMAAFGVPMAREDDPERALRAALEMVDRLTSLNDEFHARHGVAMQMRIGINTGEVIASLDPGEQVLVGGDAVNVAARLEQSAEPGTVVIGERTYLATRGSFEFAPAVSLPLKGKGEPVNARRLLGVAPEPSPRGVPGLRGELVGRSRELRTLLDMLDEVVETERPHLMLVNGPAGIGKSRLVQEFLATAAERYAGLGTLRGRCLPIGHGITYWALAEILRQFAGISLDEPADSAAEKLGDAVQRLVDAGHLPPDEREGVVHALAMTAGLTLDENPLERLAPDAVAAELARAWPAFLTAVSRAGPTVVVIEDLHWAGDQLASMLDRLVTRSSGRLLVVATARPEFFDADHSLAFTREAVSTLALRPLTEQQSAELIETLLHAAALPERLRTDILVKAEGNPFFVEEMLRRLIDEGVLVREDDGWRATSAAAGIALPDSIHAVLAARIDALPTSEKRVLQEAAVVGRIFWGAPVERAAGDESTGSALGALEDKGLILARPTTTIAGEREYIFKHALVRDVAYASLPRARRARAHADAAAWIEELAGARIDEFAELVAHHYQMAVAGDDADLAWEHDSAERERVRRRAFQALVTAGAGARRRFAISKAVEVHEVALAVATTDDERVMALEELGDDHFGIYHCDEAVARYEEAVALSVGPRGRASRVRLAEKIGRTCARWGAFRTKPDPVRIERIVGDAIREAETDEERARLLVARSWGFVYWFGGGASDPIPPDERLARAREGLAAAERLDDPYMLTRAINAVATLHVERGEFQEALGMGMRLVGLAERQASRDLQASTYSAISDDLLSTTIDAGRAVEYAERGFRLALGTSDHELMHSSAAYLRALFHVGRWSEIEPVIEAHLAAYVNESAMTCPEVQFGPPFAARFFVETGDVERERSAAALFARLLESQSASDDGEPGPSLSSHFADYLLAAHRAEDAFAILSRHVTSARAADLRTIAPAYIETVAELERWEALAAFVERVRPIADATPILGPVIDRATAKSLLAAGETAEGTSRLEAAATGFASVACPFEVARTHELLARHARRPELLDEALATFERLGATPHASRVRSLRET